MGLDQDAGRAQEIPILEAIEDVSEDKDLKEVRKTLLSNLEPEAPAAAKRKFQDLISEAGDDPENFRQALCDAYRDQN